MTAALLVGTALTGLASAAAGAIAPLRCRIALSSALTIAACALGLVVGAEVLRSGHPAVVHTTALMPLSSFSLALDRFGALFVVITAVVGICAMVFRFGYGGHGLASRTASSILPLFVTSLLLVPAASNVTTFLFLWELMAITSLLLVLTDHARRSEVQVAGQWYAVMTQVGAAALIVGLVLLATRSGNQSFAVIAVRSAHLPGVGAKHGLPAGGDRLRLEGRRGAPARVAAPRPP